MTRSLRRELEEEQGTAWLRDENEDLSKKKRAELEALVRTYRRELNEKDRAHYEAASMYRDMLSHVVTGKDADYLALNATQPEAQAESEEGGGETNAPAATKSVSEAKAAADAKPKKDMKTILREAGMRALGGGLPGAAAMVVQVCTLMPLRSTMNYQYRYGTSTREALRTLWADGGLARFYKGIGPALFQGPLSRFGDTAANAGMLSFLNANEGTQNLPVLVKTMMASGAAAVWRINLMPIDITKTMLQVEGSKGWGILREKVKKGGPRVLYHGALGASAATFAGHMPWFATANLLNEKLPEAHTLQTKLMRNAFMGFCSSVVSDCTSNSLRVVKTTKQTSAEAITYAQAVKMVLEKDGLVGLFGRGLQTRILANGIQGMLFTVIWRGLEERMRNYREGKQ